jgi:hypothetical protein
MDYHTLKRAATVDRGNAQLLIEKLIARIYVLEQKLKSIAAEIETEEANDNDTDVVIKKSTWEP